MTERDRAAFIELTEAIKDAATAFTAMAEQCRNQTQAIRDSLETVKDMFEKGKSK